MVCSKCSDLREKGSLGLRDGGVPFALGDCRAGGPHEWVNARLIGPGPLMSVYGRYDLRKVSVESAHEWLRLGPVVCVLPHRALANFLERALGLPLSYDEDAPFTLDVGDEALVPLIGHKERITAERMRERGLEGIDWRLGLMKRLD